MALEKAWPTLHDALLGDGGGPEALACRGPGLGPGEPLPETNSDKMQWPRCCHDCQTRYTHVFICV